MIEIEVTKTNGGITAAFSGHAGYEQVGKDIVCAGVSALFYALLLGAGRIVPDSLTVQGKTVIVRNITPEIKGALTAVFEGLSAIAEQYPAHVKMTGWTSNDT